MKNLLYTNEGFWGGGDKKAFVFFSHEKALIFFLKTWLKKMKWDFIFSIHKSITVFSVMDVVDLHTASSLPSFSWAFLYLRGWKIKILKLHFEWILAAKFLNVITQSLHAPWTAAHQSPLSVGVSQQENVAVTRFTPWRGRKEAEPMLLFFCFCSL